MEAENGTKSALKRRVTRRAVVGGALAAGSVAVAYAALGHKLDLFGVADEAAVWSDADALQKESVRISHLLRRAGFGASQAEFERYQSLGLEATIAELVNFTNVNDDEAVHLASQVEFDPANRAAPSIWWLSRMANTKRPLQEKMVLFWQGLLTSQMSVVRDPTAMLAQNEFFRSHAFDAFPEILRGISMDRAMMVYLNTDGSQRRAPNENYARELMELFSMGEGNYTEQDVREAARAFTGWQVPRNRIDQNVFMLEEPALRPPQFDSGTKTFLGQSGNFRPDDIIDIIVQRPASARYITRRLFAFFIYPNPSDQDIEPFVRVYVDNAMKIGAVMEAMLRSDVFYSARAYRSIVKSPIEYVVGAIKALGGQTLSTQYLTSGQTPVLRGDGGLLGAMGQVPFEPPNVAGWPGGATWLNSSSIFARLNFLNLVTGGGPQGRNQAQLQQPPPLTSLGTAAQALAHYLPLTLDDNIPDEARGVLLDYAGGADASLAPEQLRSLVYLLLASPQFHLS